MIINPYSRLNEHINTLQSVIVIVTRNPLQAMDSTAHTLYTAKNRSNRRIIPLGNTETLQRSLFNMINEHTLKLIPLETEAISDGEEKENEGEGDGDAASPSPAAFQMVYPNPLRASNRSLRSMRELEAIGESDSEDSEDMEHAIDEVEATLPALPKLPMAISTIPEDVDEEVEAQREDATDSSEHAPMQIRNPYQDGTIQRELFNQLLQNGTLTAKTDMIESFRVVMRDLAAEREYQPIAHVFDMEEDNSRVRMKMRRMIKNLHNDPYYDRRRRRRLSAL